MFPEELVSVIIPTYNRAKFLPAAIDSILNQTYKNIEIIVVDDGSTDDTKAVLRPFKSAIQYFYTTNKGPAHARNVGMKAASGKYIAFLDSDDTYLPMKLTLQVAFMEKHPEIGMVYTEWSSSYDGKTIAEEYHMRTFHGIYNRKGWRYEDIFPVKGEFRSDGWDRPIPYYVGDLFRFVLMDPLVPSLTILFQREILEKVGYQNEAYHLAEEYEFIVRICKIFQVAFLNVPAYVYRYHDNQISKVNQSATKEKLYTEVGIQKVVLQAVLDWGYGDKEYYRRNQDWLNSRIAELYHCLGEKWMEYGDSSKARACFKKGLSFDSTWAKNRNFLILSFFPGIVRRGILGISRRFRRWIR